MFQIVIYTIEVTWGWGDGILIPRILAWRSPTSVTHTVRVLTMACAFPGDQPQGVDSAEDILARLDAITNNDGSLSQVGAW